MYKSTVVISEVCDFGLQSKGCANTARVAAAVLRHRSNAEIHATFHTEFRIVELRVNSFSMGWEHAVGKWPICVRK